MLCEVCDKNDTAVPISVPRIVGGKIEYIKACLPCVKETSFYCETHDEVHLVFTDGWSICESCLEKRLDDLHWRAVLYCGEIKKSLPDSEMEKLNRAARRFKKASGSTEEMGIMRLLFTKAIRNCSSKVASGRGSHGPEEEAVEVMKALTTIKKASVIIE
jgi:hypothetical protein